MEEKIKKIQSLISERDSIKKDLRLVDQCIEKRLRLRASLIRHGTTIYLDLDSEESYKAMKNSRVKMEKEASEIDNKINNMLK